VGVVREQVHYFPVGLSSVYLFSKAVGLAGIAGEWCAIDCYGLSSLDFINQSVAVFRAGDSRGASFPVQPFHYTGMDLFPYGVKPHRGSGASPVPGQANGDEGSGSFPALLPC